MYKGLTVTLAKVVPAVSISYVVRSALLSPLILPAPLVPSLTERCVPLFFSLRQRSTNTRNGNWGSRPTFSLPSLLPAQLSLDTPPYTSTTTSLSPYTRSVASSRLPSSAPSSSRPTYTLFLYSQCSLSSPFAAWLALPTRLEPPGLRERRRGCRTKPFGASTRRRGRRAQGN